MEKSVKGVTRVQPGTSATFSRKTESTGREESKPGAVQPSLDATSPVMSKKGRLVTRKDLSCVG